ncbi:MAG: hypothetical protein J3R72DRAFT_432856 [Linnemannia gamsii]|nr:MAG: hypothetical protein J3R72DRAFT_432856 [Linnemannia gamsii]
MRPSTLLTGLHPPTTTTSFSSSSLSSSSLTPPASSHNNTHTVSTTILSNLLQLLHTFESHLLDHHKHPSFHAKGQEPEQGRRRQAWLDRNPQTVASFAYLVIELQQTGILLTAMCPSWSSSSSSPSPSSPTSSSHSSSSSLEMSEQDWLSMTGNASTEADLAKAMLALEQNCRLGMDPILWQRQQPSEEEEASSGAGACSIWTRQVQAIITSSSS